ncbi:MAG: radical SAM protein [Ignavibacteriae bacterium]|nr:MAG: radical SAM protein [Ignavibacteriota bacterium]
MLLLCNYYVTYRCNAYCNFCEFANHGRYKDYPHATLEDYKTNLKQLAELGVKFIDLTGGEPLLNRHIVEMTELAKSYKMQTSITTNTLLYKKYAEGLAGKVNLLHFSLDSPDADEHNKIRQVDCFNSVLKSVEIAKSFGEFPDILFTVTNETYKKLPRMHELAAQRDLILLVNPVFSYFGNPGLSMEALDFIEEYADGKTDVYVNPAFIRLRREGGNHINDPLCKAVSRVIVISPLNEIILPCYHFQNEKIKIDKPIKEIQAAEKYQHFLKMEGRFDFCEGCTVNCYFEPSFALPTNFYSLVSITSKIKYSYLKVIKQKIKKRKIK